MQLNSATGCPNNMAHLIITILQKLPWTCGSTAGSWALLAIRMTDNQQHHDPAESVTAPAVFDAAVPLTPFSLPQDPSVGFQLTCTSPALSMGLGPQPLVRCTVWQSTEDARPPIRQLSHQLARSLFNTTTTAKVLKQGQAGTAAGSSSTTDSGSDAASSHSGSDGSSDAQETCSAREEVAVWTILPDSTPEDVAQQLKEIGK